MIKFRTINCDDKEIVMTFETIDALQKEWDSEACDVPCMDDALIYAEIDGKQIHGDTFNDVIDYLVANYGFVA